MTRSARHHRLLLVAALTTLALRALTPEGYMPGSRGSGLLFELCPEGMPAAVMQALSGGGGHHHHHHQGHGGDESASMSGTEQCPIGHMLASAMAADIEVQAVVIPARPPLSGLAGAVAAQRRVVEYRSRAPPA
jgi:hypothetical protein